MGLSSNISEKTARYLTDFDKNPSLERVIEFSYGDVSSGNAIVRGDNLAALQALLPSLSGEIRCIYIDPPYNNGETYTHYSDDLGHAEWLRDLCVRLELLSRFLREDGSIWISIDDREAHYLKVAADKVFGRKNFITTIVWQHRTTRENRKTFSNNHEYILCYAKNSSKFSAARNALIAGSEVFKRYQNPDKDLRGHWQSVSANVQAGHATPSQFYELRAPNGKLHHPPRGRCWVYTEQRMAAAIERNDIWFGKEGNGVPRIKKFLDVQSLRVTPPTLWAADDVGTTLEAKKHLLKLLPSIDVFDTPKPERLINQVLQIATNPDDWVLDAYLGSGTTAAVALKTGRRFLGIEIGSQVVTHCVERLRRVVDGETGGISDSAKWMGGSGFQFYDLRG